MKAAVYHAYGPPSVLQISDIPKPIPQKNEVLVRVHASTVASGTIWMRQGRFPGIMLFTILLRLMFGIRKPRNPVLGFEFSGVVEETGKDVQAYHQGDKVYGTTTGLKQGAYAAYICVPETWKQGVMALKPETLTFQEAAALPVGGMTALDILTKAGIRSGQNVLIYGASGSVGTYAVQIAKYFGATVSGVCSTGNLEMVRSIGADKVIDYTKGDLGLIEDRFDIAFDAVGKIRSSLLKPLLKKGGKYCSVKSLTSEKQSYLVTLQKMIDTGKLVPVIDRSYPLDQIVDAHAYVDQGRKKGNVVITM